jgi:hypothetical protein
VRWLVGTNRGRITAAISALVLAIGGGVVSGWAQASFERVLAKP